MFRIKLPPSNEQIEAACIAWFSNDIIKWDDVGPIQKAIYRTDMRAALEAAAEEGSDNE